MEQRMFATMMQKLEGRRIFTFIRDQIRNESLQLFDRNSEVIKDLIEDFSTDMWRQIELVRGPESEASRINPANLQRITQTIQAAEDELRDIKIQASSARHEAVCLDWIV